MCHAGFTCSHYMSRRKIHTMLWEHTSVFDLTKPFSTRPLPMHCYSMTLCAPILLRQQWWWTNTQTSNVVFFIKVCWCDNRVVNLHYLTFCLLDVCSGFEIWFITSLHAFIKLDKRMKFTSVTQCDKNVWGKLKKLNDYFLFTKNSVLSNLLVTVSCSYDC